MSIKSLPSIAKAQNPRTDLSQAKRITPGNKVFTRSVNAGTQDAVRNKDLNSSKLEEARRDRAPEDPAIAMTNAENQYAHHVMPPPGNRGAATHLAFPEVCFQIKPPSPSK